MNKHKFHKNCIRKYMRVKIEKDENVCCPLCRVKLN